ncbi:MAG: YCF48-related protein [Ignavibacteria bacterium]
MKNLIILISVLLLFISQSLYSQSGWIQQSGGTAVTLNKIFFIDSQSGWIVGDSGIILKTTNSGNNWILQNSNTNHTLRSVYFLNESTGYVVGGNFFPLTFSFEKILKTTNGGVTWYYVFDTPNFYGTISDVYFINTNTGYVTGFGGNESKSLGQILKTTDAGNNWLSSGWEASVVSIKFSDPGTGYITANYYIDVGGDSLFIFKTNDSGISWNKVLSEPKGRLSSSSFLNQNTGWVAGTTYVSGLIEDLILKTSNGGMNWQDLKLTSRTFINSIFFVSNDTGWYCGSGVFKTSNSGVNWVNQIPPVGVDYFRHIFFKNNKTGWVVGDDGVIFSTHTGGITTVNNSAVNSPLDFILNQNYPNPFNPKTIINYELPSNVNGQRADVKLIVYDLLGKEIVTLVDAKQNPGSYSIDFDGSNLPSGIYFYKLSAGGNIVDSKRMVLLK